MVKTVNFITPTQISLIDISSMGDSKKRGDDSTIGQYDSGLKYCIALCLRNGIHLSISTYKNGAMQESYDFGSVLEVCEDTGKEKELITILPFIKGGEIKTGFATALGYNWEPWMILRELWSNMLDENGYILEDQDGRVADGTVVTIKFGVPTDFYYVWQNKHLYINEKEPLYKISSRVDALENEEGFLRIYKQNILVYSDESTPSKYAYNIRFGEIDERRILSNVYNVESEIISSIKYTDNEAFLRTIILPEFPLDDKEFLSKQSSYGDASNLAHNIAFEVYEQHGKVDSYNWLIESIKKRKDCKIGGKIIKTIEDSIWNYSTNVKVETIPQTISEPDIEVEDIVYESTLSAEIKKLYNFKLDVEVKTAKLKGSKVVADKYEKCLIIDEAFDLEKDFGTFIIEYIDLTQQGNVVKNLGEYIVSLLKIS